MDKASFTRLINDIYMFFDRQRMPSKEQLDLWHEDLQWIPANAHGKIIEYFKALENLPRNIPKGIRAAYREFKRSNPSEKEYDAYDDPSFPIEKLYKALRIYVRSGQDDFMQYCRSVKMPTQDIERVQNKYHHAFANRNAGVMTHKELKTLQDNRDPIRLPQNDW